MKLNVRSSNSELVRLESSDDITVVDFAGGDNPLDGLLGSECYHATVLLDMAKSPYIDSSGIGWLMQCHGRFEKSGGRLVLHSIAPMVNHCFRVLGMYGVLQIEADEETALKVTRSAARRG